MNSLKNYYILLLRLKKIINKKTLDKIFLSLVLGGVWFLVEFSFVYVLQFFLLSIGVISKSQTLLPDLVNPTVLISMVVLIIFGIARGVIYALKNYTANLVYAEFICDQRKKIAEYALTSSGHYTTAEIFGIFTEMAQQSGQIVQYVTLVLNSLIVLFFYTISGFYFAPLEMLLGIICLLVVVLPIKKMSRLVDVQSKGLSHEWLTVNNSLMNGLRNNLFLKINKMISYQFNIVEKSLIKYEKHYKDYSLFSGIAGAMPLIVGVIIIALISFISTNYLHTNPIKLLSFFYLFIRMSQTASETSGNISMIKVYAPSFERVESIFDLSSSRYLCENKISQDIQVGKINEVQLDNVFFSYVSGKNILENINLKFNLGDIVVIKGESGRGKSTLINLVLGILKPASGKVLINNGEITNKDFYHLVGYVGPEPYLLPGTLLENFEFGSNKSVNKIEAINLLNLFGLSEINNSSSLDYYINENAKLSTGQKQRLSIIRALLKNPDLLIFDEGTSNLDQANEEKIIKHIKDYSLNRITVVVTHKNSFDNIATKIINL